MHPRPTDDQMLQTLGDRVGHERLQRNQTQVELAHEAGVSVSTIRRLEAGQGCALSAFVRVLRALGMLANFDALLPEPRQRPLTAWKRAGKTRQRARKSTSDNGKTDGEKADDQTINDQRADGTNGRNTEGFQWGDQREADNASPPKRGGKG